MQNQTTETNTHTANSRQNLQSVRHQLPESESKPMKYHIIETCQSSELMATVEQFIKSGWEPLGGVSVSLANYVDCDGESATCETWAQAMMKK